MGTPVIPLRLLDECFAATHNKLIFFAYPMAGDGDLRLKIFFYSFIYFGCAGSVFAAQVFPLVAAGTDYSLAVVHGLLIGEASPAAEHGL